MDELTRARLRHALLELENLAPEMAAAFLADSEHGPLLREAIGQRRRWACPLCGVVVYAEHAPAGWVVVEPFTRVAACGPCRPLLDQRPAPRCRCAHGRGAHRYLGSHTRCAHSSCSCIAYRPAR